MGEPLDLFVSDRVVELRRCLRDPPLELGQRVNDEALLHRGPGVDPGAQPHLQVRRVSADHKLEEGMFRGPGRTELFIIPRNRRDYGTGRHDGADHRAAGRP